MNKNTIAFLASLLLFLISHVSSAQNTWPKVIERPDGKIVIYQPQPESLSRDKLRARAAFSVTPTGSDAPIFGALWADSRVSTDREKREVILIDTKVTDVKFPQQVDSTKIELLKKSIADEVPSWDLVLSLDALLASIEQNNPASDEGLKTDAPEIIYRTKPAMLVILDGDPKYGTMDNSSMKRIVNTPALLLQNPADNSYYLLGSNQWFNSKQFNQGWTAANNVPAELVQLQQQVIADQRKDSTVSDSILNIHTDPSTEIIVRTTQAELLQVNGEPNYTAIETTQLLYVSNTQSNIFMYIPDQSNYILLSGRWYSSKSLKGPWTYIASDKLPADFTKIPEGSAKDEVLASIAGTPAAKEAVMDAQVPQTAAVSRQDATCTVTYDGTPSFTQIENTSLSYATNTASSVIKDVNTFYVCDKGIWFMGYTPNGPWSVATSVPADVKKIPSSCPVYNVKYVYIYDSTPDIVYVGYTPGYTGCYINGPTIVYGTGYYYPGWYGTYYYPRPVTYGLNLHYSPYSGWSYGFSMSYGYRGPGYYGGWYGPVYRPPYYYRPPYGGYYGPYGRPGYYGAPPPGYRPPAYGPRPAGPYGSYSNNMYNSRGTAVRPTSTVRPSGNAPRPVPSGGPSMNGNPNGFQRPSSNTPRPNNMQNNVYSDPNGNVFRGQANQWQQNTGNSWQNVQSGGNPARGASSISDLNQQQMNRDRGDMRTNNFNNINNARPAGSFDRPSGPPMRGGGGRR